MQKKEFQNTLRSCPFCGGTKFKIDCKSVRDRETYSVRCNKCHARGGTYGIARVNRQQFSYKEIEAQRDTAKQMVIEAWNRRATDE